MTSATSGRARDLVVVATSSYEPTYADWLATVRPTVTTLLSAGRTPSGAIA